MVMSTYPKDCPIARTSDIVGERWSLLVLRDLFKQGPLRFQDFERARLKIVEERGIIVSKLYERHPPRFEYALTDKGKTLAPVLQALYAWVSGSVNSAQTRDCGWSSPTSNVPLRPCVRTRSNSRFPC
jgi:DNA-binding HxlR family transcriptional regulator